jgi:hypothetical protein
VTAIQVGHATSIPLLLLGFGRDTNGELYILGNSSGTVTGHTGVLQRLTQG